jgi:hypothetical protein
VDSPLFAQFVLKNLPFKNIMMLLLFFITLAISLPTPATWIPFSTEKYTGHHVITTLQNRTIHVLWTILPQSNEIEFGVASNHGMGWLAIGMSETGGMRGANIWLTREMNNELIVEDRFATDYAYPEKTTVQKLTTLHTSQRDGITAFVFKRSLDGCDVQHHRIDVEVPIWLLYAFGNTNNLGPHDRMSRGQSLVDLSTTFFHNVPDIREGDDAGGERRTVMVMTPGFTIPSTESTVYCYTLHDLGSEKHHIIQEDFVIGSPATHHIVAYACSQPPTQFATPGTQICNFYNSEDPQRNQIRFSNICSDRAHLTWGLGVGKRTYPDFLGKPVGGPTARYLLLETHYSNPELVRTIDPGSGFRLTVTSRLRQSEIGVWTIGIHMPSIKIPAGSMTTLVGECGSKCTSREGAIPREGITLFGTFLHMHKIGKSMNTKIVRGGKELYPLPAIQHYDHNFQSFAPVSPKLGRVMPGDRLITTCTWDATTNRRDITGGHSSEEEMCLNFIEYYPAINSLSTCVSQNVAQLGGLQVNYCPVSDDDRNAVVLMATGDQGPFEAFQRPGSTCPVVINTQSSAIHLGYTHLLSCLFLIIVSLF